MDWSALHVSLTLAALTTLALLPLGLAVGDVESLLLKHYVATASEAQGGKDDAATTCAVAIATGLSRHRVHQLRHRPHAACIVPERREERTTEGGLDAAGQHNRLAPVVARLSDAGIRVSLFIAPDVRQIEAAMQLGAPVVEFHTGDYAHAEGEERAVQLKRLSDMAALAAKNGIEPHAGHGLTFENVQPVAAIPQLAELNIGHYLIGEAIFTGLEASILKMRELMDAAR